MAINKSRESDALSDLKPSKAPPDSGLTREYLDWQWEQSQDGKPPRHFGDPTNPINFPVEAKEYKISANDTLIKIAEKQLGSRSNEATIKQYVKEIIETNSLPDSTIYKGKTLILPGHTADGGFVILKGDVKATTWADGQQQYEYKDGRRMVRIEDADGAYTQMGVGPRPEDNFLLKHLSDGRYLVSNKRGEPPIEVNDQDDVKLAHARLHDLASDNIEDPLQKAKFDADMARFEARTRARGLSDEEVAKTYAEVAKLMEAGEGAIRPKYLIQIAQQVMSQASDPRSIDQGIRNTCGVTTVETMIYTTNPSKAANLVRQVALTGEYKDGDDNVVRLKQSSLVPDKEANTHPPRDGERSYATQLFNLTAVNLAYKRDGVSRLYTQYADYPGQTTSEALFAVRDGIKEYIAMNPGLTDDQTVEAYRGITGRTTDTVLLAAAHRSTNEGDAEKLTKIVDQSAFENKLAALQQGGHLPVIAVVYTYAEPFYSDQGGIKAGESGAHVVTITEFKPGNPPTVSFDNQWGSKNDKRSANVSVKDFWNAMNGVDAAKLKDEVEADRAAGKIDFSKELDLLRFQRHFGTLSEAQYGSAVAVKMNEAKEHFCALEDKGTLDRDAQQRVFNKYNFIVAKLTPKEKMANLIERYYERDLTDLDLVEEMGSTVKDIRDHYISAKKGFGVSEDFKARYLSVMEDFSTFTQVVPERLRSKLLKKVGIEAPVKKH